jgi:hypothetical protein
MAIRLDHLIVPSHDPLAAAKSLAGLLGVPWEESRGGFTPVYVNETLTRVTDADTPPPWCTGTQLAPAPVFTSALRMVDLPPREPTLLPQLTLELAAIERLHGARAAVSGLCVGALLKSRMRSWHRSHER